jgi:hypothetical protein
VTKKEFLEALSLTELVYRWVEGKFKEADAEGDKQVKY